MSLKIVYTFGIAFLLLLGSVTLANSQAPQPPVTDVCLACICQASSGCNQMRMCTNGVCGLFSITMPYWYDGGSLKVNGDTSTDTQTVFANCANDAFCAASTVQNYMQKFGQDCTGDGKIDCNDYAAIHNLGGYNCRTGITGIYATTLYQCLQAFNENGK